MEENLDVLNERGEFTGKVATREECHRIGKDKKANTKFEYCCIKGGESCYANK